VNIENAFECVAGEVRGAGESAFANPFPSMECHNLLDRRAGLEFRDRNEKVQDPFCCTEESFSFSADLIKMLPSKDPQ